MTGATTPKRAHAEVLDLWQQGRHQDLQQLCEELLGDEPRDADLLSVLGVSCALTGDLAGAARNLRDALSLRPNDVVVLNNLGNVLREYGDFHAAILHYEQALRLTPDYAEAHYNLGLTLTKNGTLERALASYQRAVELNPAFADAYYNMGHASRELGYATEAIAAYRAAVTLRPSLAEAHNNLGALLTTSGNLMGAIAALREAVKLRPRWAEAHANLGTALQEARELPAALASLRTAVTLDSAQGAALARAIVCQRAMCEWRSLAADSEALESRFEMASPFGLLGLFDDSEKLQRASAAHARRFSVPSAPLWSGERYAHEKIRIAYASADLHTHATAYLAAELFELHDRAAFDVTAVSFGPDDGSAMRRRLQAGVDHFVDVREKTDLETARWLRSEEIDILIDLKGYTRDSRPRIFAYRPAPIQVNYLGYPGTMGAPFIDYLLADRTVIPDEQRSFYSEEIVYLPDCYQANDRRRVIAAHATSRSAAGLPEQGLVFCCFNNSWKITPEVFSVWMRLLAAVPGSVLWLIEDNGWALHNLRREAVASGIAAERLIFARRIENPEHLERHRLADLFLDTLPYGAHTTASDALWAGLPVLTCKRGSFAGRVGASLLQAVGLPELVTESLAEYEAKALALARDPQSLTRLRTTLNANGRQQALFDSQRFCRHLESAYRSMWQRWQRGEPPQGFQVIAEVSAQ